MNNADIARGILDSTRYVVLATADSAGLPWASPVWFATESYRELFWVSYPGARHSLNVAARPQVAMVAFDSTAAPGTGQGVYMSATAEQLSDRDEVEHGLGVFGRVSEAQGAGEFGVELVTGTARLRLYRATVREFSILDPDSPHDVRTVVVL